MKLWSKHKKSKKPVIVMWHDIVPVNKPEKHAKLFKSKNTFNRLLNLIELSKKHRKFVIVIACVLAIGLVTLIVYRLSVNKTNDNQKLTSIDTSIKDTNFPTVLPAGKTVDDFGGWKRVSPAGSELVVAYADKIDTVAIRVSQQPLPDKFLADTQKGIANLAQDFGATEKITISGNQIYIGTSSNGPQSVIFTKKNLLVLIKSDSKVSDDSWAKYINSLN